ncbi:MAG: aminotransferase class V-fold PLP-dependent enzyme [Acidimicrobiales bacterium]
MITKLVGDDVAVPCVDGVDRVYLGLDAGASTPAMEAVARRVQEFLPWYSSVHRGAGAKSQVSTRAYEDAREAALAFVNGAGPRASRSGDIAVLCRNTTEAINILAYRLAFEPGDSIVTTVAEHHANLLPWQRVAAERGVTLHYVECDAAGTFTAEDVAAAIDGATSPKLLAITGATNVTGWMPQLDEIVAHAHDRGLRVLVDAAQLAPHRPVTVDADFVAWSGHKMYAPFGTGVLVGPRSVFETGAPLLVGGGAVNLVDLDEVLWTDPPEREEAGSPNVVGAVALHAAIDEYARVGWDAIVAHEREMSARLRSGLASIDNVRLLGPAPGDPTVDDRMLAVGTFVVEGMQHSLVAARLSAEHAIGVRHGCFCAHPYLVRLLGLSAGETARYRADIVSGDRRNIPGAVRASAAISATTADIDRFLAAVADIASGAPAPVRYVQDPSTGDYEPDTSLM